VLSATSTSYAPWYVVPADRKWFARLAISAILAHTLIEIDPRYPTVSDDDKQRLLEAKETLIAEAPKGAAADPFAAERARHDGGNGQRANGKKAATQEIAVAAEGAAPPG
jgi:hypothetical protein